MEKLLSYCILVFLCAACVDAENELTDLGPNIFDENGPELFALVSVEQTPQATFFYDLRFNFSSILSEIPEVQREEITRIVAGGRGISTSQTFFLIDDIQFGTTICVDIYFSGRGGIRSRATELCHTVN